MKNNTYKINLSVPYRFLVSRLMPAYRREHPEQPVSVLPLDNNLTQCQGLSSGWEELNALRAGFKY
jgi:hypothetical protein